MMPALFGDLLAAWRTLKNTDKTLEETHADLMRIVPRALLQSAIAEGRIDEALSELRPSAMSIRLGTQEIEIPLRPQED